MQASRSRYAAHRLPGYIARVRAQEPVQEPATLPTLNPAIDNQVPVPVVPARRPRAPLVEPDAFAPLGIRAGSFLLYPAVEITGGYDTNPGRFTGGPASSFILLAPELRVRSDWSRHQLTADINGNYVDYLDGGFTPSLSRPELNARVDGRLDITSQTHADGEGRLLVGTDNPNSPNVEAGLSKLPIFTSVGGTAGVTHRFNRLELALRGSIDRTEYQDSEFTDGTTASNKDRNLNDYGTTLRGSYELTPGLRPFVEIGADARVHDLNTDFFGFRRDSTGQTIKAGTTFELTRLITGDISVGYLTRAYEDPALQRLSGFIADGTVTWAATGLTTVTLAARSSVQESVLPGVSGELTRDLSLQVDHAFRRWLIGTLKAGYGLDTYVGLNREDQRYFASAGIVYKLSREIQVKGELRQEWLHSNVIGADYSASVVLLGLRLQR